MVITSNAYECIKRIVGIVIKPESGSNIVDVFVIVDADAVIQK